MIGAIAIMAMMMAAVQLAVEFMLVGSLRPENFDLVKYQEKYEGTRFANLKIKLAVATWGRVYKLGPWLEADRIHSMIFSVALSVALAALFPMAGVVAFFGAVASTVLGQPIYSCIRMKRRYDAWSETNSIPEWMWNKTKAKFTRS